MIKKEIRKEIKDTIISLSIEDRAALSLRICDKIMCTKEWRCAQCVLLYAALPDEVDLQQLINDALQQGKRIVLPVVDGDKLLLRFYDAFQQKRSTEYGILEPTADCQELKDFREIDLAIIPGRAFTVDGKRLGRGKGYYDRLLPELQCPLWGVAFPCQMVADIPIDSWDVSLEKVVY